MTLAPDAQTAFVAGAIAGLGVALPLGAISVLLLHEGLQHGRRRACAAATGVALVDLGYAVAAALAGGFVASMLAGHTRVVRLVAGAVLLAVAARGLTKLLRPDQPDQPDQPEQPDQPDGPEQLDAAPAEIARRARSASRVTPDGRARGVLVRFVGLTVVNPTTALYFVVLTAGLGATVAGPVRGAAFAAGVFVASWAWQLALALTGAAAGDRLPEGARIALSLVGFLMIAGYAVVLGLTG